MKVPRSLLFALVLLATGQANAFADLQLPLPAYTLDSIYSDSDMDPDLCRLVFHFSGSFTEGTLQYGISGTSEVGVVSKGQDFVLETGTGVCDIQLYADGYQEVFINQVSLESQQVREYTIVFRQQLYDSDQYVVFKPVIYLYPEQETPFEVALNIHGKNAFVYPEMDGTWSGTAQPDGSLSIGEATYNYLFWEANCHDLKSFNEVSSGFTVAGTDVVSFLEQRLTELGFNSYEKADFITFWGPKLQRNSLNFVHFVLNEDCDRYAGLTISPAPDHIGRVYMAWMPVQEVVELPEQTLSPMKRDGFTVLEWGGHQLPNPSITF